MDFTPTKRKFTLSVELYDNLVQTKKSNKYELIRSENRSLNDKVRSVKFNNIMFLIIDSVLLVVNTRK